MEDIDVRLVIKRLLKKWPVFLLSLTLAFGLGFLYLKYTPKKYQVTSSLQLKDDQLNQKESTKEKFINGINLAEGTSQLEDELAVLSSYSTFQQTVEDLNQYVSLYRFDPQLGKLGKFFSKEIYYEDIDIQIDQNFNQAVEVPIYLTFTNSKYFVVNIDEDYAPLYNYKKHASEGTKSDVSFEQRGTVGERFSSPYGTFTVKMQPGFEPAAGARYYFVMHTLKYLAEMYQGRTNVAPLSEKSNVVNISLKGTLPNKEIAFLNSLTNVYIKNDLEKKNRIGQKTISFIDDQLSSVSSTLEGVENSLEQFRSNSQVVDVSTTAQTLSNQLNELMKKQSELNTQNEYFRYIGEYVKNSADSNTNNVLAPSSAGIQDPSLNSLLTELTILSGKRAEVSYNSKGDLNPRLKVLDEQIAYTKKAISENIQNLIRSSNITMKENQERIAEIKKNINRLPKDEKNLKGIQRKFLFNDNIYNYLLEKRAEAGITVAASSPDKYIIDPPRQIGSKPVEPNGMFVMLICLIAGLMLPTGFIFARDYLKDVVENEKQVQAYVALPVVESIAYVEPAKFKWKAKSVNLALQDSFRFLRHQINFLSRSQQVKVIGFTSAASGEGKTFCASNLANSFAASGKKTLLIDLDFYNSRLASLLNGELQPGYRDLETSQFDQVIQATQETNLFFVSVGGDKSDGSEGIESPEDLRLESFLNRCRKEFDFIILDTPPVGITPDYLTISKYVDYSLIVVRDQFSTKENLQRIGKVVENNAIKGGIIYNGVKHLKNHLEYYRRKAV
jgi:capsular exopolysaccharide synthesis family protein